MNNLICVNFSSHDPRHKECLEIRKKVFVQEQHVPEDLDVDEYEDKSEHFLVLRNDNPIGTGRFRVYVNFLKFERLCILQSERGKGTGAFLVKQMQKKGFQEHPNLLQIGGAQVSALGFYKKLGWTPIGKVFMDAGIEHKLIIVAPKQENQINESF